ncbi:MAG: hypothetical protein LAT76_00895 [Schleiferiaceae bacterium]|nr:hypothetical protein [Schleiferiaceae bacterium]
MQKFFWVVLLLWCTLGISAQGIETRSFAFDVLPDTLVVDTFSVIPHTFFAVANGDTLPPATFAFCNNFTAIYWLQQPDSIQQLTVFYSKLPVVPNRDFFNKDTLLIAPISAVSNTVFDFSSKKNTETFVPFDGLTKSGSISRAISVGNNQDAVLNSNLNLQLAGDIGDNTMIRASITDNNLPIQPDGNTQNLREFDRVYIELDNKDLGILRAGDFNIGRSPSYFLDFDKRVSGAGVQTAPIKTNAGSVTVEAVGSLARGRFARNQFQGQEGNQGPYKLQGNNGELFIIVISGSERVYIDGVLLKRGQEYDYTMDYNTGELTFTALRPITKDRRIAVEFQYTEQNYLRTLGYGKVTWESEKFKQYVHLYSEQDNPNQPIREELTDGQRQFIAQTGGNPLGALQTSFTEQPFTPEQNLYRITDSLGVDTVFVLSRDPDAVLFQVNFTLIGPNQGDYILDNTSSANGRVFRWVPPVNGVPQGQYQPVRRLAVPNQLQIITYGAGYEWNEDNVVFAEVAGSNDVVNRISDLPGSQQRGLAAKLGHKGRWKREKWQLETRSNYEYVGESFTTVERIRNIEFQRDWNLQNATLADQHFAETFVEWQQDSLGVLKYGLQYFQNGADYTGWRQNLAATIQRNNYNFQINSSFLSSEDSLFKTQFFRQLSSLTKFFTPKLWSGFRSEAEYNSRLFLPSDSLTSLSYHFFEGDFFFGVGDTSKRFIEVGWFVRNDDTARGDSFLREAFAQGVRVRGAFRDATYGNLEVQTSFRTLQIVEDSRQNNVTGRLRYQNRFVKNLFNFSTFYEAGIGSEPLRNITYIRVPAGTGTHTWIDYNNNGIPELDEFEPARFPDEATFVRTFLLTNEFQRTSRLKLSGSLGINPKAALKGKENWQKVVRKFSTLTNYQAEQQNLLTGATNTLNPFEVPEFDSLVVAGVRTFRNSLFFNRGILKYGGDYNINVNESQNLLSFGVESVTIREQRINMRYQFLTDYQFRIGTGVGEKINTSPGFTSRNYSLLTTDVVPAISFQPGTKLKLTVDYKYMDRKNRGESAEQLEAHQTGIELNFNDPNTVALDVRIDYIRNRFEGEENSPVGFEMLNGLRDGNNATWRAGIQKNVSSYLQLSISYEGRTSPARPTIHTGNVQVKAFF